MGTGGSSASLSPEWLRLSDLNRRPAAKPSAAGANATRLQSSRSITNRRLKRRYSYITQGAGAQTKSAVRFITALLWSYWPDFSRATCCSAERRRRERHKAAEQPQYYESSLKATLFVYHAGRRSANKKRRKIYYGATMELLAGLEPATC